MKVSLMVERWLKIINTLGEEQWIIVYAYKQNECEIARLYSVLIPNEMIVEILENASWDSSMRFEPRFIYYGATNETKYFRFGNDNGIEPLVFCRDFHGIRKSYKEISEEFRHFHNLYYDKKSNKFVKIDDNGDEDDVIVFHENEIKIKLRYIKEFLSVKKMCLVIYFQFLRYFPSSLEKLGIKKVNSLIKESNHIYRLLISDLPTSTKKSFLELSGKKFIKGLKDYERKSWDYRENKEYIDFIIDVDEEGREIYHTCNLDKLAPQYLTPVFFKKEVLTKYYANPQKYSVEDNYLKCGGLWELPLDNNHSEYVIVYLGDLGIYLTTKEQLYWKSYNVLPEGQISLTSFRRNILGQFTDPERSDLFFKYKFEVFQRKWLTRFGWYLFKPLAENDKHFYQSLRIPLTNDQAEFDQQVLALAKILIDSLNEKELEKTIIVERGDKGITKFEKFLGLYKLADYEKHVSFLRNLHDLRSSGVAHRKSRNYEKVSRVFHIEDKNLMDVFDDILKYSILLMDYLENAFLR
ncbi:MAG: hypothetical protein AYK18_12835 [Theionarchaea archaeon DG-70]|nr:MAG: hypothetical protein AYK18_12835 [Theionarchaea archaeon DG-70]